MINDEDGEDVVGPTVEALVVAKTIGAYCIC